MATQAQIRIAFGGQEVDFEEIGALPFSFSKEVDKLDNVVGYNGQQMDNAAKSITLPATKKNLSIFRNPQLPQSVRGLSLYPVQAYVNGFLIFTGNGLVKNVQRSFNTSEKIVVQLFSDENAVWQLADDTKLCELDLGVVDTTEADIIASWTDVTDTDNKVVWAAMLYGNNFKKRGNSLYFWLSLYQYWGSFRPHVRVWHIFKAFFEDVCKYSIQSTFYESDEFRNMLYVYGVGDQWTLNNDYEDYFFEMRNNGQQSNVTLQTQVRFNYIINDPKAVISTGLPVPPPPAPDLNNIYIRVAATAHPKAWWSFTFLVAINNTTTPDAKVRLWGARKEGVAYVEEPISEELSIGVEHTVIALFGDYDGYFNIWLEWVDSTISDAFISGTSYFRGKMINRFAFGEPLNVASCLHCNPVKDFIRGVAHIYGLVFTFDNIARRVFFEPRFINNPSGATPSINSSIGHYTGERNNSAKFDVSNIEISYERHFNDALVMAYKEDSSDVVTEYLIDNQNTSNIPLYGLRKQFEAIDGKISTNANPYFTSLSNVEINKLSGTLFNTVLPCAADTMEHLRAVPPYDGFTVSNTTWREYTYSTAPKVAMYYGYIGIGGNAMYVESSSSPGNVIPYGNVPLMYNQVPDWSSFLSNITTPVQLSYADSVMTSVPQVVRGVGSRFHQRYLAVLAQGKYAKLNVIQSFDRFIFDRFTQQFGIEIGGNMAYFYLWKISQFQPLSKPFAEWTMVLDKPLEATDSFDSNPIIPLFTINAE